MRKVCILLHGYLGDESDFGLFPKSLTPYYDDIVIIQMPGHISDERIYSFNYKDTMNMLCEECERYMQEAIVDLIGYSLGGVMAICLAKKYQFNKVVLLSPSTKFLNFKFPIELISCLNKIDKEFGKSQGQVVKKRTITTLRADLGYIWHRFVTRFTISNFRTLVKFSDVSNETDEKIKSPLLIVKGDVDEFVPMSAVKNILDICDHPNKQYIEVARASHLFLRFSRQEETFEKIIKFLTEEPLKNE